MSLKIGFWLNVPRLSIITVSTYNYSFVLYHKWSIEKHFNANCIFCSKISCSIYYQKLTYMYVECLSYIIINITSSPLMTEDWKSTPLQMLVFLNADCTFQFIYRIAKLQDKIDVSSRGKANFCVFPWIYQFFSITENFWKDLPLLKMSTHNPFIYDCVQEITKPFDSY